MTLFVATACKPKRGETNPRLDVNLGCCHRVCAVAYYKHMQKSQVSLSCLQAGLWLLSPWKVCGGCSWGYTTITKSVHVQSTAFSYPWLLAHIRPSLGGGGGLSELPLMHFLLFFCFTYKLGVFELFSSVFIKSWGFVGNPVLLWANKALRDTVYNTGLYRTTANK